MIISVEGAIGSGKTTLTSLLTLHLKGVEFKYSPPNYDETSSDIVDFTRRFHRHRDDLKKLTDAIENKRYVSNVFLLHNLIRNMLIRSQVDDEKHVFVDSFWDPFWHFESQYYEDFFRVIKQCIPLPDITLFLRVSAKRSVQRAAIRDPDAKDRKVDIEDTQKKMDSFIKWGKKHIPNFYAIAASHPADKVLEDALKIIKEYNV